MLNSDHNTGDKKREFNAKKNWANCNQFIGAL